MTIGQQFCRKGPVRLYYRTDANSPWVKRRFERSPIWVELRQGGELPPWVLVEILYFSDYPVVDGPDSWEEQFPVTVTVGTDEMSAQFYMPSSAVPTIRFEAVPYETQHDWIDLDAEGNEVWLSRSIVLHQYYAYWIDGVEHSTYFNSSRYEAGPGTYNDIYSNGRSFIEYPYRGFRVGKIFDASTGEEVTAGSWKLSVRNGNSQILFSQEFENQPLYQVRCEDDCEIDCLPVVKNSNAEPLCVCKENFEAEDIESMLKRVEDNLRASLTQSLPPIVKAAVKAELTTELSAHLEALLTTRLSELLPQQIESEVERQIEGLRQANSDWIKTQIQEQLDRRLEDLKEELKAPEGTEFTQASIDGNSYRIRVESGTPKTIAIRGDSPPSSLDNQQIQQFLFDRYQAVFFVQSWTKDGNRYTANLQKLGA